MHHPAPILRLLLACGLWWLMLPVAAHQFAPALLELTETAPGQVTVHWKEPLVRVMGSRLRPVLPGTCEGIGEPSLEREDTGVVARWTLSCPAGLVGATLAVEGIASSRADVLVQVTLVDGEHFSAVLRPEQPSFRIPGGATGMRFAFGYLLLGVEHILLGFDHLLFVLALVLLVDNWVALLKTITAFTLAHSITLALAVLGLITLPAAPVEILIALSILFLAAEGLLAERQRVKLPRHGPWRVAFGFGLIHGLGFASALSSAGLIKAEIPSALLFFNLGVEFGQLLFVAAVLLLFHLGRQRFAAPWPERGRLLLFYLIGTAAAYWAIERTLSF